MSRALAGPAEIGEVIHVLEPRHVKKKWGYETHIVNHVLYCGKILTVSQRKVACSLHYHAKKHETFHILRGALHLQTLLPTGRTGGYILKAGSTLVLPPRTAHRFWIEGEVCDFIEVSTMDDPDDSIRIFKSGPAPESLATFEPTLAGKTFDWGQ